MAGAFNKRGRLHVMDWFRMTTLTSNRTKCESSFTHHSEGSDEGHGSMESDKGVGLVADLWIQETGIGGKEGLEVG